MMDQQESAHQATCDAETGEPGVLMVSCGRPEGHEGDHHAEYEWPQEPPRTGGRIGDAILRYLEAHPFKGDPEKLTPRELAICNSYDGRRHFIEPVPEVTVATLELLNSDLIDGIRFERGLLHLEDSFGTVLSYEPLYGKPRQFGRIDVMLRRVWPRDDETASTEGAQHV